MQASYDHRVLLNDSDVPALNLVQFASGANGMGYYMYHGGNNPLSLIHNDDPENTMQVGVRVLRSGHGASARFVSTFRTNLSPPPTPGILLPAGGRGQHHPLRVVRLFRPAGRVWAAAPPLPPDAPLAPHH